MTVTIGPNHILVDLATMTEVKGATGIDEAGVATIVQPDINNEVKTTRRPMAHGGWRVVRRR